MQNNENDKRHQIHFPILVGHRGMGEQGLSNSECYLENTIGSFLEAADEGAHFVEFDVQITKNEVPIIHHNFTLKGKYLINMTADEFLQDTDDIVTNSQSNGKSYEACSKNNERRMYIDKYKRCTLEEVFTECQKLGFNVEIKFLDDHEQNEARVSLSDNIKEYLKPILDVVAKYEKTNLFYSSFSLDVCKHLMKAQNDHSVFYLEDKDFMTAFSHAKENKFAGLVIDTDIFEMSYIKLAKNAGLRLILYGGKTNDRAFVTEFVKNGGDGVITDKIREIRSAFSQTQ